MTPIEDTHPVILRILRGIEEATVVGAHRQEVWERCWSEHARPDYFTDIVRYHRELYEAPGFERSEFEHLRRRVFLQWLAPFERVNEFGCGTGDNLDVLRKMGLKVCGYDWAQSAVMRCENRGVEAHRLDMFSPPPTTFKGAVLTVHAMEQLGKRWRPFFDYIMRSAPPICVHIEPIDHFYDKEYLLDHLALRYHEKRGYLSGFYEHLLNLQASKKVEVLHAERSYFGSLFHEAYSVIVWRPTS